MLTVLREHRLPPPEAHKLQGPSTVYGGRRTSGFYLE